MRIGDVPMWDADLTGSGEERHALPDRDGAARDRLWRCISASARSDRTGPRRSRCDLPRRPVSLRPNAHHASAISWAVLVGCHDQASLVRPTTHGPDRDLSPAQSQGSPDRVSGQELRCDRTDHCQDGKHGLHSGRDTEKRYPRSRRQRGHAGDAHKRLGDDERGSFERVRNSKTIPRPARSFQPDAPLQGAEELQMAGCAARETSPRRCARGSVSRGDRS